MVSALRIGLLAVIIVLALTSCSNEPPAAPYIFNLQAEGVDRPPEGTTLGQLDPNSPIYVSADHPDADVHVEFDLQRKGDYLVVGGKGDLTVGGRKVPFTIDQVSVVREEKLSDGQPFLLGGLQVNDKVDPSTFAFGFRFLPEAKELQLLLSNGTSLIVFGGGEALTKNAAEIERIESENRLHS